MLNRTYEFVLRSWNQLFGRPSCRRWNNLLVRLGTGGLGVGNADPETNGEQSILRQHLQFLEQPVIFDVGANEGDYTQLVVDAAPGAIVHAFEPHPQTFSRLAERFRGVTGIHCNSFAIGARIETRKLWDYTTDTSGSEHATFHPEMLQFIQERSMSSQNVEVRTIDDVARERGIESIALLKLDVEGHELGCLEGATELLSRDAIDLIQFEFNMMHLHVHVHMMDFANLLRNFDLYRILPHGLLRIPLNQPMFSNFYHVQNVLAIRRP